VNHTQRFVIVGGGLGGASPAVALRENGFEGRIQLAGAEAHLPYHRPPLSKAYLRGEAGFEEQLVNPAESYAAQRIGLTLGARVSHLDARRKVLELDGGYLHTFWSDQYEHLIEYVGFAATWDRLVFRGDLDRRAFLGFYLKDGRVRAAVGLNRGGDPEEAKADGELKFIADLIQGRVPVDPARLADEATPLARLRDR
jgi:hypothetical protein